MKERKAQKMVVVRRVHVTQRVLQHIQRMADRSTTRTQMHWFPLCCCFWFGWYGNDPSAGSPTETLLRLHLPLNDEI